MTSKEKCKLLKHIRKEIAESNNIVYLTSECTYEGDCLGTCPKCDAEIRYLDNEIKRKIANSEEITLSGLTLNTLTGDTETYNSQLSLDLDDNENEGMMNLFESSDEYMGEELIEDDEYDEDYEIMGLPRMALNLHYNEDLDEEE